jgi:hypothetical protein
MITFSSRPCLESCSLSGNTRKQGMFPTTSLVSLLCVFVIILTTKNRIGFGAVRRPPPCYHSIELTNNDPLVWRLAERCQPTLARIVGQAASQARLRHTTGRMHAWPWARAACLHCIASNASAPGRLGSKMHERNSLSCL